jgi:hypothetical protein
MTVPRTWVSTRQTHACTLCERKWHGQAHFYGGSQLTPMYSYCKDCFLAYQAVRRACGEQYTADELLVRAPGIERIRRECGPRMLRVCYAAGVKPSKLGRLIAKDFKQHPPVRGWLATERI